MTHARQQIREAVAARLAGLVTTVAVNRARSLPSKALPAIAVYALEEEAERISTGRTKERHLTLAVDVFTAAGADDPSADLDALCAQVETAMDAAPRLGGLANDSELTRTDIELTGAGDQGQGLPDLAAARLQYRITYRTPHGSPDTVA